MPAVTVGVVQRAFKFRSYPTSKQHDALGLMCAAHAELYNAGLQERRDAWAMRKTSISVSSQMLQLRAIRTLRPDQAVWSFTSQQQTLRRLDKAFAAFFRRVKAGEAPGYPRFRAASRFDSVDFRHGDGIKFLPASKRLKIQGVGHVQVRLHRNLPENATLGQVSVKREGSGRATRWFVVIPVHVAPEPLPMTGAVTGIDMGVASFLTTSEGVHIPNPRHLKAAASKLAAAQKDLAAKKRGSNRLLNGQAAKTGLNKSILDAGWGVFLKVLTAKAEEAGREIISVNPANTSRTSPPVRALRQGKPALPSRLRLPAVPVHRACRHCRCDQHSAGRNCPSRNRSGGLTRRSPFLQGGEVHEPREPVYYSRPILGRLLLDASIGC